MIMITALQKGVEWMENGSSSLVCPLFVIHCNQASVLYFLVTVMLYFCSVTFLRGCFCSPFCLFFYFTVVALLMVTFFRGCFIPLFVIFYFFCFLLLHTSLRGCVDICHCVVNLVCTTRLFVHVDTLGASLSPPIFLSIHASLPCTTTNTRSLSCHPRIPAPFSNMLHLHLRGGYILKIML